MPKNAICVKAPCPPIASCVRKCSFVNPDFILIQINLLCDIFIFYGLQRGVSTDWVNVSLET